MSVKYLFKLLFENQDSVNYMNLSGKKLTVKRSFDKDKD